MSVPSKSKKAPTEGPSGLCSTSSTSSSMSTSVVGDGDGALGAVGRSHARLVEEGVGDLVDETHAVPFVVGLEHLGSQHVAASVSGARVGVDVQLHLAENPRWWNWGACYVSSTLGVDEPRPHRRPAVLPGDDAQIPR